jgi:hypothetical protein
MCDILGVSSHIYGSCDRLEGRSRSVLVVVFEPNSVPVAFFEEGVSYFARLGGRGRPVLWPVRY